VTLEGEIVGGGNSNEIDLIVTGPTAAGAVVTLIRTSQFNSCSNASLSGNFGIQGQGFVQSGAVQGGTGAGGTAVTTATGNPAFVSGGAGALGTPFALLGRFVADGAGNFTSDFAGTQSPLARGITGSYTVNADCSGTARLTDASGITRNISFILVNEEAQCSTSARLQSSARQKLRFVFTDSGVIGDGTARQQ
jgi:hypothetical protein